MKKVIAIILALVFVFTLSACGNKDTVSDVDISESTKGEAFIKPENYASVLLVSINSQFKLYLDESNKVLAVEPVNDDAKSFCDNIGFENKSVEAVVENIVEKANEKGFIKENAVVNFEITEQKDGVDSSNILTTVVSAANQKATELKIEIKTEIKESDNSQTTETNSENKQTGESSKTETSSKNEGSTSKPTTSTKPAEGKPTESSKPTHTHSYSAETCTTPQKCSCGETKGSALGHSYSNATCTEAKKCSRCGATNGSALGHKWQEATCKAPKTCSLCKATEGNIGNHKYTSGKCIYCGDKQIINPKTGLKKYKDYYCVSADGDGHYTLIIWQFDGTIICPRSPKGVYSTNEERKESDDTVTYKGKTYYPVGSGGPLPEYTLTDTEIILKYSEPEFTGIEYRLIVNYEYDLEVIYSSDSTMFKKGDILDLVE